MMGVPVLSYMHVHFHFSDGTCSPPGTSILIVHDLALFFVISTCSIDLVLYIGLDVTMVTEWSTLRWCHYLSRIRTPVGQHHHCLLLSGQPVPAHLESMHVCVSTMSTAVRPQQLVIHAQHWDVSQQTHTHTIQLCTKQALTTHTHHWCKCDKSSTSLEFRASRSSLKRWDWQKPLKTSSRWTCRDRGQARWDCISSLRPHTDTTGSWGVQPTAQPLSAAECRLHR